MRSQNRTIEGLHEEQEEKNEKMGLQGKRMKSDEFEDIGKRGTCTTLCAEGRSLILFLVHLDTIEGLLRPEDLVF